MLFVQRLAAFSGILQKVHEFFFRQHLYTKRLSFGKLGTGTGSGHDQRSLLLTLEETLPPFASILCVASSLENVSKVPVRQKNDQKTEDYSS